ncbi:MAG: hypothetical protein O2794_04520 [bacterium]|nr:hypothetical protein [bacterium]
MVEKIDKVSVVAGRLIRVKNTKKAKFSNANNVYYAVQVENCNGKGERCLLFTEREIASAEKRALNNVEDLTKKGFFTDLLD